MEQLFRVRVRQIGQIRSNGRMACQAATGCNRRRRIETQIGRWKSVIGPRVQSAEITEIQLGQKVLNTMIALGRRLCSKASTDPTA